MPIFIGAPVRVTGALGLLLEGWPVVPPLAAGAAAMGGEPLLATVAASGAFSDGEAGSFEHAIPIMHNANCAAASILSRNMDISRLNN